MALERYKNVSDFRSEMEKNIEEIIVESVQLFNKDPREYHPFYLRVFKYVTIGQRLGHFPPGRQEGLKIWRKYDELGVKMWESQKMKPVAFERDMSPYATFLKTGQAFVNGQLVKNSLVSCEKLSELEQTGRLIVGGKGKDVRNDLERRLQFIEHCHIITSPADCETMNNLWTKFCNGFEPEVPIKTEPSSQSEVLSRVIVTLQLASSAQDPASSVPSFSPPPSPPPQVEQKCATPKTVQKPKRRQPRKMVRFRLSLAKKRVKKAARNPAARDKRVAVLEKRIGGFTRKIKLAKRQPSIHAGNETTSDPPSVTPEFTKCDDCGETYRTCHLSLHKEAVHKERKDAKGKTACPFCPHFAKRSNCLWPHFLTCHHSSHQPNPTKDAAEIEPVMNSKEPEGDKKCDICRRRFSSGYKVWRHKVDIHGIIEELDVSVSRKPGWEKKPYKNKKARSKVECPKCGKIMQSLSLSRHLIGSHGMRAENREYCCGETDCAKKFRTKIALQVHLSECHDPLHQKIVEKKLIQVVGVTGRIFGCAFCEWKASSKAEVMVHLVAAHPQWWAEENEELSVKCPHCQEMGQTEDKIRAHVELAHPECVWRCIHPDCRKVILSPGDMQEHFFREHGDTETDENGKVIVKKKEDKENRKSKRGPSKSKNAGISNGKRSRSGRLIQKRRRSEDSDEWVASEDEDEKETKAQVPARRAGSRRSTRRNNKNDKVSGDADLEEVWASVPLRIRRMFRSECRVRLERLTARQIEKLRGGSGKRKRR